MRHEVDPILISKGVELLHDGFVEVTVERDGHFWKITEPIIDPLDAAYYSLRSYGYSEKEILTRRLGLKTLLGRVVARHLPDWKALREEREAELNKYEQPSQIDSKS